MNWNYWFCFFGLHDWGKWQEYKYAALQCQYCKLCNKKRTALT